LNRESGDMARVNLKTIPKIENPLNAAERPTEAAFIALLRTCGLIRRTQQPFFARFGISPSQWAVLRLLHRAAADGVGGLRLTDLSDRLLIRPPSVTGVVDRLQRQSLVARTTLSGDQRARQVKLTRAGRELVERVLEEHVGRIKNVLTALSVAEQNQLQQLLDRLSSHLEAVVDQEVGP
jgi:DNA-binding MarR family transcriptional regulator